MKFIKKLGIGTWISLATVVVFIIALIIYGAALSAGTDLLIASGSQLFYVLDRAEDMAMISAVTTCGILTVIFLAASIVLAQFEFKGIVGKVCEFVVGALRIVAPALIIVALLNFVYGSFTGLGWTFFSNEELVIAPEAIAVGKQVIVGLVFFAIAAVAGIVASFFAMTKKEQA